MNLSDSLTGTKRGRFFSPFDLINTPEGKAALAGSQGFGAGLKLLKHVRPLMRSLLDAEWAAVRAFAPDVIVGHPKSFGFCRKLEVKAILSAIFGCDGGVKPLILQTPVIVSSPL